MNRAQQIATLNEITCLRREVRDMRRRQMEIASGAASATVSAGSGSKSYSNWTPAQLRDEIAWREERIVALRRMLAGRPAGGSIRHVVTVRC